MIFYLRVSHLGVVARLIPIAIGMGLFQPPDNRGMMGAVPGGRLGIASGLIGAMKNLGSMSGVAITSLTFNIAQGVALGRLEGHNISPSLQSGNHSSGQ